MSKQSQSSGSVPPAQGAARVPLPVQAAAAAASETRLLNGVKMQWRDAGGVLRIAGVDDTDEAQQNLVGYFTKREKEILCGLAVGSEVRTKQLELTLARATTRYEKARATQAAKSANLISQELGTVRKRARARQALEDLEFRGLRRR